LAKAQNRVYQRRNRRYVWRACGMRLHPQRGSNAKGFSRMATSEYVDDPNQRPPV